jgi:hypothetical protein
VSEPLLSSECGLTGDNSAADIPTLSSRIDFVIALGGDGTLLRVSSLFDAGAVPPVLGVSAGTLGFMMPIRESKQPRLDAVSSHSPLFAPRPRGLPSSVRGAHRVAVSDAVADADTVCGVGGWEVGRSRRGGQ